MTSQKTQRPGNHRVGRQLNSRLGKATVGGIVAFSLLFTATVSASAQETDLNDEAVISEQSQSGEVEVPNVGNLENDDVETPPIEQQPTYQEADGGTTPPAAKSGGGISPFADGPTGIIAIEAASVQSQPSGVPFDYIITFSCQALAAEECTNAEITIPLDTTTLPSMVPSGLPVAKRWTYEAFGNDDLPNPQISFRGNDLVLSLPASLTAGNSYGIRLRLMPPRGFTANDQTWSLLPTMTADNFAEPAVAPQPASNTVTAVAEVAPVKQLATGNQTKTQPGMILKYNLVAACHQSVWIPTGHLYLDRATITDQLPAHTELDPEYTTPGYSHDPGTGIISWQMEGPSQLPVSCGGTVNSSGGIAGDRIFKIGVKVATNAPDGEILVNRLSMTGVPIGQNEPIDVKTVSHQIEVDANAAPWASNTGGVVKQTLGTVGNNATYAGNWITPISPNPLADTATVEAVFQISSTFQSLGFPSQIYDPLPCLDGSSTPGEYPSLTGGAVCENPAFHPTVLGIEEWSTHQSNDFEAAYDEGWRPEIQLTNGNYVPIERTSIGASGAWTAGAFFAVPAEHLGDIAAVRVPRNDKIAGSSVTLRIYGYADASLDAGSVLRNTGTVTAYRLAGGPEIESRSASSTLSILPAQVQGGMHKSISPVTVQPNQPQQVLLTSQVNSPTPFSGPIVMTDLLPAGYTYTGGATVGVTTSYRGVLTQNGLQGQVEVIGDYLASGRQLVRVTVNPASGTEFGAGVREFTVGIQTRAPEQAGYATNTAQLFLPGAELADTCKTGSRATDNILNLDGSGNPEEPYCQSSAEMRVRSEGAPGFSITKTVKGDIDPAPKTYPHVGVVDPDGGAADYQLTWTNTGGGVLTNVVVYDVLPAIGDVSVVTGAPRGSEFQPRLESIGTVPAGVKLQYSEHENVCQEEIVDTQPGCVSDSWSDTPPGDLANVRAIRLVSEPGQKYDSGESFSLGFTMSVPELEPVTQTAWNNATGHAYYDAPSGLISLAPVEEPKVGLQGMSPSIEVLKSDEDGNAGDDLENPVVIPTGEATTLRFAVTNNGNVPLQDISVRDQVLSGNAVIEDFACDYEGTGTLSSETTWAGPLPVGASFECEATLPPLAPEELHHDRATVSAVVVGLGEPVEDSDDFYATNHGTPDIKVIKRVLGDDANTLPGPNIRVGTVVDWTYEVTVGEGDVSLGEVEVISDAGTPDDPSDDWPAVYQSGDTNGNGRLDVDETWIFVTPADKRMTMVEGQQSHSANVRGVPPSNLEVTDTDPAHFFGSAPEIRLVTYAQSLFDSNGPTVDDLESPWPRVRVGDKVRWTYKVTNTGNTALTDVVVSDDQLAEGVEIVCEEPGSGNTIAVLEVGAEVLCEAFGVAVDGEHRSHGVAGGYSPEHLGANGEIVPPEFTEAADVANYLGKAASLELVKTVNKDDADDAPGILVEAGAPVVWEYLVTNRGSAPLTNLSVTDDQLADEEIVCPEGGNAISALDAGESVTCRAEGRAIPGAYINTGTVTGLGPETFNENGEPVEPENVLALDVAQHFGADPQIDIEKTVNGAVHDSAPGLAVVAGSTMRFDYRVSNNGNVPLTEIEVEDDQGVIVVCPETGDGAIPELAPGDSIVCSGTAVVDFDGQYSNVGIVTARTPETRTTDGTDAPGKQIRAESTAFAHTVAVPDTKVPSKDKQTTVVKASWLPRTGFSFAGLLALGILALAIGIALNTRKRLK